VGTGIQAGVAVAYLERFFAIFNIRIDGHWVDIRDCKTVQLPQHCVYNIANFKTYELDINLNDEADCGRAYDLMKRCTLEVADSCPVGKDLLQMEGAKLILKKGAPQVFGGEGIVWTMVPTPEYDTQLFNFKTKADQFLPVNAKVSKQAPTVNAAEAERVAEFVDYVLGTYALSMESCTGTHVLLLQGIRGWNRGLSFCKKWVVTLLRRRISESSLDGSLVTLSKRRYGDWTRVTPVEGVWSNRV
jgi:hypothetical protein